MTYSHKILGILLFFFTFEANALQIESPAFQNNARIPTVFTCDGENIPPPLSISDISENTISLVLLVDDPDTEHGTFDHWVIYNIPPKTITIDENTRYITGKNGKDKNKYLGPCPPPGKPHRYFFKLYALDISLDLPQSSTKKDVEKSIEGHVLEKTQMIGIYSR